MLIYKAEKELGLTDKITAARIVCNAEIISGKDIREKTPSYKPEKVVAAEDAVDLYSLDSILVTNGWNLNACVFEKDELWNAKATPNNKPFNLGHNTLDIIGHITNTGPVDKDFKAIALDMPVDELPEKLHLLTSAVIYKLWDNEDRDKQIATIIEEIKKGDWYVSMECWFDSFDYAIMNKESSGYKLVARTSETAFLSQYLRNFGGTGVYNDCKVGIVPRGILFAGKGLVKKPANPESIIFASVLDDVKNTGYILNSNELPKGEIVMNDLELKAENEKLKVALSEAQNQLKDKDNKEVAEQLENLKKEVESKTAALNDANAKLEKVAGEVIELKNSATALQTELNTAKAELAKINTEKLQAERAKLLAKEAGIDETSAVGLVNLLVALSDEAFKDFVAKYKPVVKTEAPTEQETLKAEETPKQTAGNVPETDATNVLREQMSNFFSKTENK